MGEVASRVSRQSSAPPAHLRHSQPFMTDLDRPPPEAASEGANDGIDAKLQAYFDQYPDFDLDVKKLRPGWYLFGQPIGKKVYIKMNGRDSAVLKIGGGFKALEKFLDEHRLGLLRAGHSGRV